VYARSTKTRLTEFDLARFPEDTLFHRIARTICAAGCLPRKELFEAWEVARRVRRRFRGGRVVDLCAGHGLVGQIMLLLDDSSPEAVMVDRVRPASSSTLAHALAREWPKLEGRVRFFESGVEEMALRHDDVVVSIHACGALTDVVIEAAVRARARVAVLPCCHDLARADDNGLSGWLDGPLAVDVARAMKLRGLAWRVRTQTLPEGITPHNRLLTAEPGSPLP
jgi:hypothetical protein